ncbi:MAG TPA: phosphoglycerate dehydrogenase [Candidatus Paceibacterota bacterium]|nr:phosphoglycerate dehydrogenase [Verrucomicrobiota bacterium]HRZ46191.1 phosphoglycerate dehydrogenase [Candidatus Paceibacterota bacterium]HRZ92707.1 phosphoglycerate dehydrogenase [Candidatus Paceibacterota bacterium]
MKILVCDPVSAKGIALLQQQPKLKVTVLPRKHSEEELLPLVRDMSALVIRSETQVTRRVIEVCKNLRVVGRAGVGVDNVDVEAATQNGVVVMNTPGGNTISTAELTFSMLMSLARKIPQANQSIKNGEWNRKAFQGTELNGKTLGIIGLGRIGTEVAKRAQAFGMTVLAHDPYLSPSRAKSSQVEIVDLNHLYAQSDFITVHMPLTDETRGMINSKAFELMKKGVRILNCARGGIVNESDLHEAIQSGQVGGAALDVYEKEPPPAEFPLRALPQVIMTPHLGASTKEAQDNVGIEVAEAIIDFLLHGTVRNAVNIPNMDVKTFELVRPYLGLGEKLGRLVSQLGPKRNERLVITYGGKAAEMPTDPITRAVAKAFLESVGGSEVNHVNAFVLARSLGLQIESVKSSEETDYNEWLHVAAFSNGERVSAGGTFFGRHHEPRIVRLFNQTVEIVPKGVLLLFTNKDRPGIVGYIGTLLSKHGVNIANMSLNRDAAGGQALTVLNLDSQPPAELIAEIQKDPDIAKVRVVRL